MAETRQRNVVDDRFTSVWGLLTLSLWFGCGRVSAQEPPSPLDNFSATEAVIAKLSPTGEIELIKLNVEEPLPATTPAGLLVWKPQVGHERWMVLKAGGAWPGDAEVTDSPMLAGGVRGSDVRALGGVSSAGSLMATIQLEPLDGTTLIRGAAFVTPQDGAEVLSSRPTLRRPSEKGKLPARMALLSRGDTEEVLLRIPFRDGESTVSLMKWTEWPAAFKDGLTPGRYTLRFENGLELNRFTVVEAKQRQRTWGPIDSMFALAGDKSDPLAMQYAVEHLLSFRTDDDRPAFLGDALDLVESIKTEPLAAPLQRHRNSLRDWLDKLATDPGYQQGHVATKTLGTDTGLESVDSARRLIAAGQWADAMQALDQISDEGADDSSRRQRGLKSLYRGVVFAEAGQGQSDQAIQQFGQAIRTLITLKESPQRQADLLRVFNNLANFRLLLAQNSLGNHAFQMAAGVDQPVLSCLINLIDAREQYAEAANLADTLNDRGAAYAIRVNRARTSALLADVIRTLDVVGTESGSPRQFLAGERAASDDAVRFASAVTRENAGSAESLTQAAAWELLAQLSYRQRDFNAASEQAQQARAMFVREGDLAGVETMERLSGLIAIARDNRVAALQHFSMAQHLAELQRSRFPQDQTGQARAGYFARHSFVYEKLVELHLAEGHPREALRFAELAKARAAQDLLATLGIAEQDEPVAPRDLDELLADWPADVAAVEYFLGAERGWGFVIRAGNVRAFPLVDAQGRPVATRELVANVRQRLTEFELLAEKMNRRVQARRGFDHAWQEHLFDIRRILLPDDVLAELRESPRLIVVPQHILHYLPFAGLVTKRDEVVRSKNEMVSPRFILDEPFSLTTTPSLTTWDLIRRRPHGPLNQVRAVGVGEAPHTRPLAGVKQDLQNLRNVYGDKLKLVLQEGEARESNVKQLLAEPGLLMFASHGHNNPDRPADSFLIVMADDSAADGPLNANRETNVASSRNSSVRGSETAPHTNGDVLSFESNEGRLTAREIFARRVNASLIVMSACYSGLGDRSPQPGDDLFGLQRAFLHAGARSVLSGMWDVYDDTAPILIRQFHEQLLTGKLPSQALAESQRAFLNQQRSEGADNPWIHPYFWAVFGVAGAE